jgi:hypothetical protein
MELTDPLRFFIGAIYRRFSSYRDPQASIRFYSAFFVLFAAVAIPVIGGLVNGIGDGRVYAITAFIWGIVTLIPDRVGEIRENPNLYPKTVKTVLVGIEYVVVLAAMVLIVVWRFGGPLKHNFWRGVTWGVGTVAAGDLVTVAFAFWSAVEES